MFKLVYRLLHVYSTRETAEGEPLLHVTELGYFSTKAKTKGAILKYKDLSGFKDYSVKNFKIKYFIVNLKKSNNKIYELYHSYLDKDGYEEFKYLGIYPTLERAEAKRNKLIKSKSVYRDNANGFDITEEILDSDNSIWDQGFDEFN